MVLVVMRTESHHASNMGSVLDFFQKKWQTEIVVDQDGFPIYRRRNDGKFIEKNHIALDNRYVVPYNPNLLLKC